MSLVTRHNYQKDVLFEFTGELNGYNSTENTHVISYPINYVLKSYPIFFMYSDLDNLDNPIIIGDNLNKDLGIKYNCYEDSGDYYINVTITNNRQMPIYYKYIFSVINYRTLELEV